MTCMMLRRYSTLGEAQIVRSLLISNGIYASIGEEHQAAVAWAYVQALGGVTVWIALSDYQAAKDIIRFAVADAKQNPGFAKDSYDQPTKYRWGPIVFYWLMQTGLLGVVFYGLGWLVLTLMPSTWWPVWSSEHIWMGRRMANMYSEYTPQTMLSVSAIWLSFFILTLFLFLHLTKRYYRDRAK